MISPGDKTPPAIGSGSFLALLKLGAGNYPRLIGCTESAPEPRLEADQESRSDAG